MTAARVTFTPEVYDPFLVSLALRSCETEDERDLVFHQRYWVAGGKNCPTRYKMIERILADGAALAWMEPQGDDFVALRLAYSGCGNCGAALTIEEVKQSRKEDGPCRHCGIM